uniref:beta-N-acetylhexosaminidase n=1 Tax=Plectus sambesii TaxID=2011161 RepID=A0A914V1A8_9BILA
MSRFRFRLKRPFVGNRIFHFDLKGAAPKVAYFKEMFAFLKTIGATGILIEWEDMFPYEGILADVRNGNAYTKKEIATILNWAVEYELDIIPLVQTFGHLEWILKLEKFAKYRQVERYPQVICLADDEAVDLVKTALNQVLAVHREFPMPFFHIGADEAFQVRLGDLIEPVVWNYAENLDDQLYPDMWERFGTVFPFIWGASAFKGADGPSRFYSNVPHYLANHRSWISQMTTAYKSFKQFRGLILTGWQRFDHFAILCELLPVGLMSAAINFITIKKGHYDRSVLREASTLMDCSNTIDIDAQGIAGYCNFPGSKVYQEVQQLKSALDQTNENVHKDYQVRGWLTPFNIKHNYSQAWYLDQLLDKVNMHITDLEAIAQALRKDMEPIFFADTIDEFLFEYLEPGLKELHVLREGAIRLGATKYFGLRPFKINSILEQRKEEKKVLESGARMPPANVGDRETRR